MRVVKARKAHNPKTGAQVMLSEGRRVSFKAGKHVTERVAAGAAHGAAGERRAAGDDA